MRSELRQKLEALVESGKATGSLEGIEAFNSYYRELVRTFRGDERQINQHIIEDREPIRPIEQKRLERYGAKFTLGVVIPGDVIFFDVQSKQTNGYLLKEAYYLDMDKLVKATEEGLVAEKARLREIETNAAQGGPVGSVYGSKRALAGFEVNGTDQSARAGVYVSYDLSDLTVPRIVEEVYFSPSGRKVVEVYLNNPGEAFAKKKGFVGGDLNAEPVLRAFDPDFERLRLVQLVREAELVALMGELAQFEYEVYEDASVVKLELFESRAKTYLEKAQKDLLKGLESVEKEVRAEIDGIKRLKVKKFMFLNDRDKGAQVLAEKAEAWLTSVLKSERSNIVTEINKLKRSVEVGVAKRRQALEVIKRGVAEGKELSGRLLMREVTLKLGELSAKVSSIKEMASKQILEKLTQSQLDLLRENLKN